MDEHVSQTFRFCPRCGVQAQGEPQSSFHCAACDYSHFFTPCAAVAAILRDDDGRVLLLRRAKEPAKGLLDLPGGFVDAGETLEDAVRREVLEETGLKLTEVDYLTSFPNEYPYKGVISSVADAIFVCRAGSLEPIALQEEEVDEYLITKPGEDEVNRIAFPSLRKAMALFLAYE